MKIPKRPLRHKGKELAYVRFGASKPVYLGAWPRGAKKPPADVLAAFKKAVVEWLENHPEDASDASESGPISPAASGPSGPRRPRGRLSVDEVWTVYHTYCQGRYRKHGAPTSEVHCIRSACRIAARLYGTLPAVLFGATELLAVRAEMIRLGWTRESINKAISRVRAMFRWAAEVNGGNRLIPMSIYHELMEVRGLEAGRCEDVTEGEGIGPVDMELVERTLPLMSPVVQVMVRLHYHMGCRSQDVVSMRPCDVSRHEDPEDGYWAYRPASYKTEHHARKKGRRGKDQQQDEAPIYWIKPDMQALLAPLLLKCESPEAYLFTTLRSDRRGRYTTGSYRAHVTRACDKLFPAPPPLGLRQVAAKTRSGRAFIRLETEKERLARLSTAQRAELRTWQRAHGWTPYQLRHTRATVIAAAAGTEAAQRILNHKDLRTTQRYAKRLAEDARRIMKEHG